MSGRVSPVSTASGLLWALAYNATRVAARLRFTPPEGQESLSMRVLFLEAGVNVATIVVASVAAIRTVTVT